jgi:hypothetical protein
MSFVIILTIFFLSTKLSLHIEKIYGIIFTAVITSLSMTYFGYFSYISSKNRIESFGHNVPSEPSLFGYTISLFISCATLFIFFYFLKKTTKPLVYVPFMAIVAIIVSISTFFQHFDILSYLVPCITC